MNALKLSARTLLTASVLALGIGAGASAPAFAQEGWQMTDTDAIDATVDSFIDNGTLPVLYVRLEDADGNVVYEHGVRNETLVPADEIDGDTWFRVWSMSKIITISAALDLIEDGILRFDDPVTEYIPEFSTLEVARGPEGENLAVLSGMAWGDEEARAQLAAMPCPLPTEPMTSVMTVRDLLNHKGGFYYTFQQFDCLNDAMGALKISDAKNNEELIADLATLPLLQQPGEGYYYGLNTTVLGLVMERATGQSLAEIVAERITAPLGIEDLRYDLPEGEEMLPRVTGKSGALQPAVPEDLDIYRAGVQGYDPDTPLYMGGEGMIGTTAAYADFLQMLLGRGEVDGVRILDEMTIEALTSPHTRIESEANYNGYNLGVDDGVWTGGGYEGTHFWIDTNRGLVGLIMSQIHAAPDNGGGNVNEVIKEALYEHLEASAAE